ncbi:ATP-binding protein [Halomonas sp.]|uniref:ATP-binding protein n=1 Tax=Halomonas sp. TaxID=1486246 RepID=UPI003564B43C
MSLKTRLMLMILGLPLLLLTLLVGTALTLEDHQRHATLRDQLTQEVERLAPSLSDALARENSPILSRLVDSLLALPHVQAVSLRDGRGTPLLERGMIHDLPASTAPGTIRLREDGRRWLLQAPLTDDAKETVWLELVIDTTPLLMTRYRQLASSGLVLMLAGLLLFLAAYLTTRRLCQPLEEANRCLDRLALGRVPERLTIPPAQELAPLARRINELADHIETARQERQAQIEQATNKLQRSMETIEVQNIELDLAHRRALEANRVKSEFLANMSHEIRTPLNGIVGFCRLLGRSQLEPRQREWLDQMQRACDNLLMLVNDVLDFSKLEAGRVELETLPLDMVALVDEVLGLQAPLSQQKGLQLLGLVYDDVPANLQGDPMRIRQVLTNLVNNAIKFTDQGEVIVRVMLEEAEAGRMVLQVSVSDTGMGLSEEARRRLFQAFQQADISHHREFGGTGLGLAICRQLVEQMGGEIDVKSVPGQGSTFFFMLPLWGTAASERAPELVLRGELIAIDEPHSPTRRALKHLMTRWGARVTTQANAWLEEQPVALVVAGICHEDLDEASLARWQRRLDKLNCPALLLVNASPLDLPPLPLPHGGEVLGKPISRSALADALVRQLHVTPRALPTAAQRQPISLPARLLVVDDTASNRLLLGELLAGPKLTLTQAASGEEALALAQTREFDMVLMDIRMAGMDGMEASRALRRLGGVWHRVPIIAVTAHLQGEQQRRLRENGLDDVLIKPLQPQRLAHLLEKHLGIVLPTRPTEDEPSTQDAPQAQDPELPVVDLELGTRLAGGREPLARQLLETLADSLPGSEAAIRDAVAHNDEVVLLDALHALNGACRYCGTPRLGLLAETLETRLRSRGFSAVVAWLPDLYTAMGELCDWQAAQPSSTTKATARAASSESDR